VRFPIRGSGSGPMEGAKATLVSAGTALASGMRREISVLKRRHGCGGECRYRGMDGMEKMGGWA